MTGALRTGGTYSLRGGNSFLGIGPNSSLILAMHRGPGRSRRRRSARRCSDDTTCRSGLDDRRGRAADVLAFADDRMAIGGLGAEQQRQDGLLFQVPRLVLVALQLADDRALFLLELVLGVDPQVPHAVGLDLQSGTCQRSAAKSK